MATSTFTKKTLGLEAPEPGATPPPATSQTSFVKKPKLASGKSKKREIPEGLWTKCPKCSTMVFDKELDENLKVCPRCQHHFPIASRERIHSLVETCTFEEMDADMISVDILSFTGAASYRLEAGKEPRHNRPEGRGHHRHLQDRRAPGWVGRDGLQVPWGLDGVGRW